VQWAYYWPDPEDVHYTNSEAYYNYYDPTVIKTVTPRYTSTTSYIYLHAPGTSAISIYGSSETFESTYFALNHRGYIYSELAGVYTFQSTAVDDILFFWGGPDAYSGWNKSNTEAYDVGGYVGAPTFSVTLSAGIYYPIRIVYANAPTRSNENIPSLRLMEASSLAPIVCLLHGWCNIPVMGSLDPRLNLLVARRELTEH
jgi:hypothetical protein